MDGVIDFAQAREFVGNGTLWPRVRDFLWDFAPQVHGSWLEDLGRETLDMSSPRVRKFILDSLGVEPCFHDFQKDDGSRLLLLDGATLAKIAQWLGALACADSLRRVTDGATVRELKSALRGIYPEVFGYTMYFDLGSDFYHAEAQSAQRISEEGCKMLFSALSKLPGPFIRRMELKFPKGLCDLCLSAPLREVKYTVILKLLKLKFPEAYALCSS